jgi:hypothetical protein
MGLYAIKLLPTHILPVSIPALSCRDIFFKLNITFYFKIFLEVKEKDFRIRRYNAHFSFNQIIMLLKSFLTFLMACPL